MKEHSTQFLRKRKFLLVLPVLILPFITLAFWALGGGKDDGKKEVSRPGLDLQLPDANVKKDPTDKLGFYEKAASDSAQFKAKMKEDPYFKNQMTRADTFSPGAYTDPNEAKVYSKISQLNKAMRAVTDGANKPEEDSHYEPSANAKEAERLQQMIRAMQQQGRGDTDPEMTQVNGMLEKILDIQHPDRLKNQLEQGAPEYAEQVLPVTTSGEDSTSKRFYSLEDTMGNDANAIRAVVHETQTVVSGATVKLRLLTDIFVAGQPVPKDNFVYGTASLEGERLKITIKDIRCNSSILPVALSAYDLDGMEGIYIPGAIGRDVAKQSVDNSLQQVGISSLDPSIGMQAAGAGIQAAKTLIGKKVKLIRVTLKAGYHVLLTNKN